MVDKALQESREGHEGDASFEDLAVSVVRGALPRRRLQDVVDAEDDLSGLRGEEEQLPLHLEAPGDAHLQGKTVG